ncbi:MAG: hypothetical protein AAFU58_01950 [Pseudomonadota bacterium]
MDQLIKRMLTIGTRFAKNNGPRGPGGGRASQGYSLTI